MNEKPSDIAEHLRNVLRGSGKSIITIPWSELYKKYEYLSTKKETEIHSEGLKLGIVIEFGDNVLVVTFDRVPQLGE